MHKKFETILIVVSFVFFLVQLPNFGSANSEVSCGINQGLYKNTDTSYRSFQGFCIGGNIQGNTPKFPSQGQLLSWNCADSLGTSIMCFTQRGLHGGEIEIISPKLGSHQKKLQIDGSTQDLEIVYVTNNEGKIMGSNYVEQSKFSINISNLEDGEFMGYIYGEDKEGNMSEKYQIQYYIDTTIPQAPTISQKNGTSFNESLELLGVGEENMFFSVEHNGNIIQEGRIDNAGEFKAKISVIEGKQTYYISVKDLAGNQSLKTKFDLIFDTTKPKSPEIIGIKNGVLTTTGTHMIISSEVNSIVKLGDKNNVIRSGTTNTNNQIAINLDIIEDARHELRIHSIDNAGNTSDAVDFILDIDRTPPLQPIIEGVHSDTIVSSGTQKITWKGEPNTNIVISLSYDIAINTKFDSNGNYTHTLYNIPEGTHQISIYAIDGMGNTSNIQRYQLISDRNPPNPINILSHFESNIFIVSGDFLVGKGEKSTTAYLQLQDIESLIVSQSNNEGIHQIDLSGLSDGLYNGEIYLMDKVGNRSTIQTIQIQILRTIPKTPILISNIKDFSTQNYLELEIQGQIGTNIYMQATNRLINGGIISQSGTIDIKINDIEDGTYERSIYAIDSAYNKSKNTTIQFTIDTNIPEPVEVTHEKIIGSGDIRFQGIGEPDATIYIDARNGQNITTFKIGSNGSFDQTIQFDEEGNFVVDIYQIDKAGNKSAAQVMQIINLITKPNPPEIHLPPEGAISSGDITLMGFGGIGNTINLHIQSQGQDNYIHYNQNTTDENGKFTYIISGLSDGKYTARLISNDIAGNQSIESTIDRTIDSIRPTKPTIHLDTKFFATNTVKINGIGEENTDFYILHDGVMLYAGKSTYLGEIHATIENIIDGEYSLSVIMKKKNGLISEPSYIDIIVDTINPEIYYVSSPSDGSIQSYQVAFVIKTEKNAFIQIVTNSGKNIGMGYAGDNGRGTITGLHIQEGLIQAQIIVQDQVGNSNSQSISYRVQNFTPNLVTELSIQDGSQIGPDETISGKTSQFATVTIEDEHGNILGTTLSDTNGNFYLELTQPYLTTKRLVKINVKNIFGEEITTEQISITIRGTYEPLIVSTEIIDPLYQFSNTSNQFEIYDIDLHNDSISIETSSLFANEGQIYVVATTDGTQINRYRVQQPIVQIQGTGEPSKTYRYGIDDMIIGTGLISETGFIDLLVAIKGRGTKNLRMQYDETFVLDNENHTYETIGTYLLDTVSVGRLRRLERGLYK